MARRTLPTLVVATLLACMSADVQAQRPRQDGLVRIQLQIQMFIAGPTDESEEAQR